MTGEVDDTGTPIVRLTVAGNEWVATIDTGFNGDLELPNILAPHFALTFVAESSTTLAGGQVIEEDIFSIQFPFDGEIVEAEASFAPTDGILIGTGLLRRHRLEINFVTRTVLLEKVATT
jgi:predicted aspartyl protease